MIFRHQVAARPSEDTLATTPNTTPSISSSAPIFNNTPVVNMTECRTNNYNCSVCLKVKGCKYVEYPVGRLKLKQCFIRYSLFKEVSRNCLPIDDPIKDDPIKATVIEELESCDKPQDDTTTADPVETTTHSSTDATTSSTAPTTSKSTSTTTTTPKPTTSITTSTTTTVKTTTTASTTTPIISTTAVPVPPPEGKGGRFDGWSFFGGILLTLGLAAIGLVGFKYYKLRSGSGGNYNRF